MVDTDAIRWMLRNVKHSECPPDAVCMMELAGALVIGELPSMTQREWSERWHCGRGKVRRIASKVADHYRTTNEHYRTTLLESFPHLTRTNGPAANTTGPTRARSSLKKKKEMESPATQPGEVDCLTLEGKKNTSAPIKVGGSRGVQAIWAEETQARGWFAGRLSRKALETLGPFWKEVGPERFREMVGAYMDAVQAGEHWQSEASPQWGPFAKDIRDGLNSGSVGDSEEVQAVVAAIEGCEGWHWHGRNWGEVSAQLGPIADAVGRAMVEATGAEEPWSAYGQVKGMNDWKMDKFKKKAAAAARRKG